MSADQWEAWKTALKVESETTCPHCGKPLINCKCWGELRDDAERFRWLCLNPDWHFIELLCQEFVAESSGEFYQGICAAIDKFRRVEASADSIRDRINAAMGGRQPVPWSAQQSADDTPHE